MICFIFDLPIPIITESKILVSVESSLRSSCWCVVAFVSYKYTHRKRETDRAVTLRCSSSFYLFHFFLLSIGRSLTVRVLVLRDKRLLLRLRVREADASLLSV